MGDKSLEPRQPVAPILSSCGVLLFRATPLRDARSTDAACRRKSRTSRSSSQLRREPCVDVFRLEVDDGPVVASSRDFRLWIIGDRGAAVEIVDRVVAQRQATCMASPVRGSNSSSTDFPSLPATLVIESKCLP